MYCSTDSPHFNKFILSPSTVFLECYQMIVDVCWIVWKT